LNKYSNGSHTGITSDTELKNYEDSSSAVMFVPGFIKIRQVIQNIFEIHIRKDMMTPLANLSLYKQITVSSLIKEGPMYIYLYR